MSNAIAFPAAFQEKLRDSLFEKFMELFPKEQLDHAIQAEINAFFTTEVAPFVKTTVKVKNPNYRCSWDQEYIDAPALTSSIKITPFRQLIWTQMHEHLQGVVQEVIEDRKSEYGKAFAEYLNQHLKPAVGESLTANMQTIGIAMSSTLMSAAMKSAADSSYSMLHNAMRHMEVSQDVINQIHPAPLPVIPGSTL